MGTHLLRRKQPGQSIVLIALVFAILVGMVGLSVDVGNAYAAQRGAQRAVNSAALAGTDFLIRNASDDAISAEIKKTLEAHGLNVVDDAVPGPNQVAYKALYLDDKGEVVGTVGKTFGGRPTDDVTYIKVSLEGKTETYLARLFNQDTLPVVVDSFGGRGPCFTGIYPLAIYESAFENPQPFQNNARYGARFNDNFYRDKPWRRLYLNGGSSSIPQTFAFLRWNSDVSGASIPSLQQAFTDEGTINGNFVEAPWPADTTLAGAKPEGYAFRPGYINENDWVYGATVPENQIISSFASQFDFHLTNRTEMLLPLVRTAEGSGTEGKYQVSSMGRFLLLKYGRDTNLTNSPTFVDLAYLGPNDGCPTLVDPPQGDTRLVNLSGEVMLTPKWKANIPDDIPVDMMLVIDASESMNYEWSTDDNASDPDDSRKAILQRELKGFIDNFLDPDDRMAIIKYNGNNGNDVIYPAVKQFSDGAITNAIGEHTGRVSAFEPGTPDGKARLKARVDNEYKVGGSTPSAIGLEAGRRYLRERADTERDVGVPPVSKPVRKVLVFMTDGVANVYLDGAFRLCSNPALGKQSERCLDELKAENQPIDQMVQVANRLKAEFGEDIEVYTVALGRAFDQTGLIKTASHDRAPWFSIADNPDQMRTIFQKIKEGIRNPVCAPREEVLQPPTDPNRFGGDGSIGVVRLLRNGQELMTSNIEVEGSKAVYRFEGLQPGTYTLQGYVMYKGLDGVVRRYDVISSNGQSTGDVTTNVGDGIGNEDQGPPLNFDLGFDICAGT